MSAAIVLSGPLPRAAELAFGSPICADGATVVFKREADLPTGALKLINDAHQMADVGEPFCETDVCEGRSFVRFISAHQSGCNLTINYEVGGAAYNNGSQLFLRQIGGNWTVLSGSSYPYDAPIPQNENSK